MKHKLQITKQKDGVILLLVVVILTAIFSISVGVFGVILGQIRTSETFESSSIALNAVDQSIERTMYRDRQESDFPSPGTTNITPVTLESGGCMSATIVKTVSPNTTQIVARGISTSCGVVTERSVARAFLIIY